MSRPNIVAINGSERDGNTADVLRHAASVANGVPARDQVWFREVAAEPT